MNSCSFAPNRALETYGQRDWHHLASNPPTLGENSENQDGRLTETRYDVQYWLDDRWFSLWRLFDQTLKQILATKIKEQTPGQTFMDMPQIIIDCMPHVCQQFREFLDIFYGFLCFFRSFRNWVDPHQRGIQVWVEAMKVLIPRGCIWARTRAVSNRILLEQQGEINNILQRATFRSIAIWPEFGWDPQGFKSYEAVAEKNDPSAVRLLSTYQ